MQDMKLTDRFTGHLQGMKLQDIKLQDMKMQDMQRQSRKLAQKRQTSESELTE